jgi:hypothetical protein
LRLSQQSPSGTEASPSWTATRRSSIGMLLSWLRIRCAGRLEGRQRTSDVNHSCSA